MTKAIINISISGNLKQRERKLETLILEGLGSGKATPFTKADFEAIKKRGIERLKNKADKKSQSQA